MLQVKQADLYYGASQALRKVDLKAAIGTVTCLLGRNGVGKTSLLRAIIGQQPLLEGSIHWQDQDITHWPAYRRARAGIAYVPQGREIFPQLTVEENLRLGYSCLSKQNKRFDEDIFSLFPVLQKMLGRRGGDLSGGQQQQLAIARALVTRPNLLVLDEPTEGIQPSIILEIGRVIKMLREQEEMAILLVEQYFEFASELADAYVVMDRGEVVLAGTHKDVQAKEVRRWLTI